MVQTNKKGLHKCKPLKIIPFVRVRTNKAYFILQRQQLP
jgi:hypothetical protein